MTAVLVDTNLLVYAWDPADALKQERAIATLDGLRSAGLGRLSVQSLAEFFAAITRGAKPRLTPAEAARQVEGLAASWPVLDVTPLVVMEATRGVGEHRLSYWDAQLWATARLNQIPVIFSEDFTSGSVLKGVRFVDPFHAGFDLRGWVQ
jgi:predicted nucleic acid-binding protein